MQKAKTPQPNKPLFHISISLSSYHLFSHSNSKKNPSNSFSDGQLPLQRTTTAAGRHNRHPSRHAKRCRNGPQRQSRNRYANEMWRRPNSEAMTTRYRGSGVWKVKLVISAAELAAILTEDSRTEELIESVRTVAKCGGMSGGGGRNGVVLDGKDSTPSSRIVLDGKNSAESKKDVVLNEVNSNNGRNDNVLVEKNNTSGRTKTKPFPLMLN
ncbi:hypothetical protein LINPERHAP1_LOCUS41785 [Linum perenne]